MRNSAPHCYRPILLATALLFNGCSGNPEPDSRRISSSGFGAYEASLARYRDGAAVAWYDTRDANAEIYLQLVNGAGQRFGEEHRLTSDPEQSYEVDIDAAGDDLAVVWYSKNDAGELRAEIGLWNPAGGFNWRRSLSVSGGESRNPVVRAFDNRLFSAWIERDAGGNEAIWIAYLDQQGESVGQARRIAPVGPRTWNLNAAVDERGTAYVAFDAPGSRGSYELFLARIEEARSEVYGLTPDDGHASKYPDVAVAGERLALTWFDERDGNREVYLYAGGLDGLKAGDLHRRSRRITRTGGASIGAYLAWNGDTVGLAWSDDSDGAYDIFYRSFDDAGAPTADVRRLSSTPADSLIPAIVPWQQGFAIAWNEVESGPTGMHDPSTRSEVHITITGPAM